MRKAVLTILTAILSCALAAQELKVMSFELDVQDLEAKLNPVIDENGNPAALIRINTSENEVTFSGSIIGTPRFNGSEWLVYTKKGAESLTIKVKGIPSETYRFKEVIEPSYVYLMQLNAIRPERFEVFIVPGVSWHPSHSSYHLMVGAIKKYGAYMKVKSDLNTTYEYSEECDGQGRLENGANGWFTGESQKSRFSFTAGGLVHIKGPFTAYAGIGYGRRTLLWENYDHSYTMVSPSSVEGVETEAGLMFKAGNLILTAGVSETGFKWMEGTLGLGVQF